MALNQMLDSWSTESLAVFATIEQVIVWPAGQAVQTLGPSGALIGIRPISMDAATYYVVNGLSYSIEIINNAQYNDIVLKTAMSPFPSVLNVNATYPDAIISLWPVPNQNIEMHFVSVSPLDQPALTTTVLSFPPGYLRAFASNLALEIASEFGIEPPKSVQKIAMTSKRDIKRINQSGDVLSMPAALVSDSFRFNVFTGE
jgi:hypothetical protein